MNRKEFFKFTLLILLSLSTRSRASGSSELVKTLAHIKKVEILGDKILIHLSKELKESEIKTLEINDIKRDKYRKIFDIKSILYDKPKIIKDSIIDEIRFAQFQKDTSRFVLSNSSKIDSGYSIRGRVLEIGIDSKNSTIESKIISLSKKVVVIDAGHGGRDSGASYSGKREKDSVFDIAIKLEKELKKRNYKVYLTRKSDKYINLKDRTKLANQKKADIFISIHANAISNKSQFNKLHGVETYFLSPARSKKAKQIASIENKQSLEDIDTLSQNIFLNILNREKIKASNKLAIDVQEKILLNLRKKGNYSSVRDGGVREAPFWVLVGAQMPSVLIETGYITNKRERVRLFNSHYQRYLAKGIADGVDGYFIKNLV